MHDHVKTCIHHSNCNELCDFHPIVLIDSEYLIVITSDHVNIKI